MVINYYFAEIASIFLILNNFDIYRLFLNIIVIFRLWPEIYICHSFINILLFVFKIGFLIYYFKIKSIYKICHHYWSYKSYKNKKL